MSNNYTQELQKTAQSMVTEGKGLLAMDESTGTCNKCFEKAGIPTTEENRRAYRELILTTPSLSNNSKFRTILRHFSDQSKY